MSISREAREQLRREKRQRRVDAKKERLRIRQSDRRALSNNVSRRIFGL